MAATSAARRFPANGCRSPTFSRVSRSTGTGESAFFPELAAVDRAIRLAVLGLRLRKLPKTDRDPADLVDEIAGRFFTRDSESRIKPCPWARFAAPS